MIETIIQSILYFTVWCAIALTTASFYLFFKLPPIKQGSEKNTTNEQEEDINTWIYHCLTGLSVIAVSAPYIGLFGTVWHIIEALSGIGSGNLNVAAIASPIGQALYATLWGLGAAIPALIAHRIILSNMALRSSDEDSEEPSKTHQSRSNTNEVQVKKENATQDAYQINVTAEDFAQSPVHLGRG